MVKLGSVSSSVFSRGVTFRLLIFNSKNQLILFSIIGLILTIFGYEFNFDFLSGIGVGFLILIGISSTFYHKKDA